MALFGRPTPKEEVEFENIESYLNKCFDERLKNLSARISDVENSLANAHSAFRASLKRFSESNSKPNMEYLYGIKEGFVISQKPNYSNSLLNIASLPFTYEKPNLYYTAQNMLDSYNRFIERVLKANSTFRLVMMAYVDDLNDVKSSFNTMEKICKEFGGELNSYSRQFNEYKELDKRIKDIMDRTSRTSSLIGSLSGDDHQSHSGDPDNIKEAILNSEDRLERARRDYNDANAAIARLLLPIERVARKHDYISVSKIKLTDYIKEFENIIKTQNDSAELKRQISEAIEEIESGKIVVKNHGALVSQLKEIKENDFLASAESLRLNREKLRKVEEEAAALNTRLQHINAERSRKEQLLNEREEIKSAISSNRVKISAEKEAIEKLFMNYYKKNLKIRLDAAFDA